MANNFSITLADLITAAKLSESKNDHFLKAVRVLLQDPQLWEAENYESELSLFEKNKLIKNNIEIHTFLFPNEFSHLLCEQFDYNYIWHIIDNIATQQNFMLVSTDALKTMKFTNITVADFEQDIVGLEKPWDNRKEITRHYFPIKLREFYQYDMTCKYFYIKKQ